MQPSKTSSSQVVQLIKGEFSPTQAKEIVLSLISQKISYHKLEEIQLWEKDHDFNLEPIRIRIRELEDEKQKAEQFISEAKKQGKNLEINGIIEMKASE